jgi:hypothetical protein
MVDKKILFYIINPHALLVNCIENCENIIKEAMKHLKIRRGS